ncbi:hypothetical protein QUF76_17760, partial [Desulfobacterales bacterium HSG16]|nr:hypothetical protein [Desulfobacterales bacterium HSG16]
VFENIAYFILIHDQFLQLTVIRSLPFSSVKEPAICFWVIADRRKIMEKRKIPGIKSGIIADDRPDIEKEISALLKKKDKDFLTITQVIQGISIKTLRYSGLNKKSKLKEIQKKLTPVLGRTLSFYQGARSTYIGLSMPNEQIVLNMIRKKTKISAAQLIQYLPMLKANGICAINDLLTKGVIKSAINESYKIFLSQSDASSKNVQVLQKNQAENQTENQAKNQTKSQIRQDTEKKDLKAFKSAYDKVGRGRNFVLIHLIREYLKWPEERFDQVLAQLAGQYRIELQGGDPSAMTQKQIAGSFTDEKGRLRITVSWRN